MRARESAIKLQRQHPPDEFVSCPACDTSVKAKNVVNHVNKMHGDDLGPKASALTGKVPCASCGVLILPGTAADNGGLCMPCRGGYRDSIDRSRRGIFESENVSVPAPAAAPESAPVPKTQVVPEMFARPTSQAPCEELLELAHADLYRSNLFRVLGLDTRASAVDVRRRQNRIEMERKYGGGGEALLRAPFPISPPPDPDAKRVALQRLADPEARLLDEIFWIWPLADVGASGDAWQALTEGRHQDAISIWRRHHDREPGSLSSHNLAVVAHLQALDIEAAGASADATALWGEAFELWTDVLAGEAFWSAVKQRVVELDDKKLTAGFVRRIRGTLPRMLLLINAKLAVAAAERGDQDVVTMHLETIEQARFGSELEPEVMGDAIRPLRGRIKTLIDTAIQNWEETPKNGDQFIQVLDEEAAKVWKAVEAILPEGDLIRISLHDSVAEAMLSGIVAYNEATSNHERSRELLSLAKEVAEGAHAHEKLNRNIDSLEEIREQGNSWYSPGYWELDDDIVEALESAQDLATGGDLKDAIEALVALQERGLGAPLRRCLGYSLSVHGIEIFNSAQDEFDPETSVIRKILGSASTARSGLLSLLNRPTPTMTITPRCPGCGSTHYTSWVNLTHGDVDIWMCSECAERHNAELEELRVKLREQLTKGWCYLLVADQIDPDEKGIRRNLEIVKGVCSELEAPMPSTSSLIAGLKINLRALQLDVPWELRPSEQFSWGNTLVGAGVGIAGYVIASFVVYSNGSSVTSELQVWVSESLFNLIGAVLPFDMFNFLVTVLSVLAFAAPAAMIFAAYKWKFGHRPPPLTAEANRDPTINVPSVAAADDRSDEAAHDARPKLSNLDCSLDGFSTFLNCNRRSTEDDMLRIFGKPDWHRGIEEEDLLRFTFCDGEVCIFLGKRDRIEVIKVSALAVDFLLDRGLADPALALLGQPLHEVTEILGSPSEKNDTIIEYSPNKKLSVAFISGGNAERLCDEIYVIWYR